MWQRNVWYLWGSGMRAEPRPRTGLAPVGQTPKTTAEKAEKYEPISWELSALILLLPAKPKLSSREKLSRIQKKR